MAKRKEVVKSEATAPDVQKAAESVDKQATVRIKIPKLKDRQDEYVPVGINGYVQYIPVGETVEVAEQVAEILEQAGYL